MPENNEPNKDAPLPEEFWSVECALEQIEFSGSRSAEALKWLKKNLLPQPDVKPRSTPGPWHPGKGSNNHGRGAVVAEVLPVGALSGSENIDYYGGFMIAESVAQCNIHLIAAAPLLRDVVASFRSSSFSQNIVDLLVRYGIKQRGGSVEEILAYIADEALRRAGDV
jgi:hypothetical protein